MKEKIKLSGVPETMLQTIYARAKESGGRGTIHDTKAEEIVGKLDYDFTLAEKDTAMHSGVIARTIVLDRLVGEYLAAHPGARHHRGPDHVPDAGGRNECRLRRTAAGPAGR